MTSIEQGMVATGLTIAMILIFASYPQGKDLGLSTRAMLHPGFEGRTEIVSRVELKTVRELLRGSRL